MKTLLKFAFISMLFFSCDEADRTNFDSTGGQSLIGFSQAVYDLPVVIDATGTLDVVVNSSTKSDVDRVFNISIVDEETDAIPASYTLPSTVTIPAGSFQGILKIDGVDNGVDINPLNLVFEISSADGEYVYDSNKATVKIGQVCPITDGTFSGNYLMEQLTPNNPADGVPVFPTGVVNIVRVSETQRRFSANFLGDLGIGQPDSTVPFSLSCGNTLITSPTISTFLICNTGAPTILLGPGAVNGEYDATDDSEFTLTLAEYVNGTGGLCGSGTYEVVFKFTKQ